MLTPEGRHRPGLRWSEPLFYGDFLGPGKRPPAVSRCCAKPAAIPLMVRWSPRATRPSVSPARCRLEQFHLEMVQRIHVRETLLDGTSEKGVVGQEILLLFDGQQVLAGKLPFKRIARTPDRAGRLQSPARHSAAMARSIWPEPCPYWKAASGRRATHGTCGARWRDPLDSPSQTSTAEPEAEPSGQHEAALSPAEDPGYGPQVLDAVRLCVKQGGCRCSGW